MNKKNVAFFSIEDIGDLINDVLELKTEIVGVSKFANVGLEDSELTAFPKHSVSEKEKEFLMIVDLSMLVTLILADQDCYVKAKKLFTSKRKKKRGFGT